MCECGGVRDEECYELTRSGMSVTYLATASVVGAVFPVRRAGIGPASLPSLTAQCRPSYQPYSRMHVSAAVPDSAALTAPDATPLHCLCLYVSLSRLVNSRRRPPLSVAAFPLSGLSSYSSPPLQMTTRVQPLTSS